LQQQFSAEPGQPHSQDRAGINSDPKGATLIPDSSASKAAHVSLWHTPPKEDLRVGLPEINEFWIALSEFPSKPVYTERGNSRG